jgi:hypothetical protein
MPKGSTPIESKLPLEVALGKLPLPFRSKILQHFSDLKKRFAEGKDEAVGVSAGKLCESVLRFLQHETSGESTPFNKQIGNFADECRKLITSPNTAVTESLRVVMPRALVFAYTIRSKRGIGHVGGDVDANRIDAMTISRTCDWIVCELIRVYHNLSLEEAQDLVDGLAQRTIPDVWHVGGKKRVLRDGLDFKQKVLLLCYQEPNSSVLWEDLFSWVEYSNQSMFKTSVLTPLHKKHLIEYDTDSGTVTLSPLGVREVEEKILKASQG